MYLFLIFFNKVYVHAHMCPWRPSVSLDSPRAEVKSSTEQIDWMLGTELIFSARGMHTLNH